MLQPQVASEIKGTKSVAMAMVIILDVDKRDSIGAEWNAVNDQKNESK